MSDRDLQVARLVIFNTYSELITEVVYAGGESYNNGKGEKH